MRTKGVLHIKGAVLLLLIFSTCFANAQDGTILRLGVKNSVPNKEIESLISNHQYNYVDAFEYELTKLLVEYAQGKSNIKLELVPIQQNNKLDAIVAGTRIDALLYTFSETSERRDSLNIIFSEPYFQNRAIGLITNDIDIDRDSWKSRTVRIGHVANTTSGEELKKIEQKYDDNVILSSFDNHESMMNALKKRDIDAAAGDASRLVYEVNDGEFYFGGNLPTKRSWIRDNYCIGVTPSKPKVVDFFNDFIRQNSRQILSLKDKWLTTAIDDAYNSFYNKKETKLLYSIYYIAAGFLSLLFGAGFWVWRRFKIKDAQIAIKTKEINDMKKGIVDVKIGGIISDYEIKIQDILDVKDIAKAGQNFFREAQKSITYVGSGGFLSNEEFKEAWSSAMTGFLNRGGKFKRVVDLPAMVSEKGEIRFVETDNFLPYCLEKDYISRFLNWLIIQHCNLKTYQNQLTIVNSRGASLWGYGIVIMIKDEKEVLIFTTDKNQKFGTVLPNNKLAGHVSLIISEIEAIGESVNCKTLMRQYFSKDKRLKEMIDSLNGSESNLPAEFVVKMERELKIIEDEFFNEKRHPGRESFSN